MCGRYRLSRHKQVLLERFGLDDDPDLDWSPRYNIAPAQLVPAIRQDPSAPRRQLSLIRWGLIPFWAKDPKIGYTLINARAETALAKPAFRDAMKKRRCLIPADGFYEWQKTTSGKQPYCFTVGDNDLFAFAGIWERWKDPEGKLIETCSILTTSPNGLCREVHDRMPVILPPDSYDLWLDPGLTDVAAIAEMLKPFDDAAMDKYPVSTRVNTVQNDDAACAERTQHA